MTVVPDRDKQSDIRELLIQYDPSTPRSLSNGYMDGQTHAEETEERRHPKSVFSRSFDWAEIRSVTGGRELFLCLKTVKNC